MKKSQNFKHRRCPFSGRPRITLTFDDGPNPPYTSKILSILKRYRIKAVFFLLGYNVKLHPRTAKRIKEQGHIIGNHSFSHKDLTRLKTSQIKIQIIKTERVFKDILGIKPAIFRAPYGSYDKRVRKIVKDRGYKILNWDICPQDWKNPKAEIIAERVISKARDKSVILLHDGSNIRQGKSRAQTVLTLEIIIKNKKFVFDAPL